MLVSVAGDDSTVARAHQAHRGRRTPGAGRGRSTVEAGGAAAAGNAIGNQVTHDLGVAESIAIPLTMILLILAFGQRGGRRPAGRPSAWCRSWPRWPCCWLLGSITNVSIYALNLTTALGLGLAIDYSLLMVNRYREELAGGASCDGGGDP